VRLEVTMMPSTRLVKSASTCCRSKLRSSPALHKKTEVFASLRTASMPSKSGMLNRPYLSVEIKPMVNVCLR
jgi:hypothetical protein